MRDFWHSNHSGTILVGPFSFRFGSPGSFASSGFEVHCNHGCGARDIIDSIFCLSNPEFATEFKIGTLMSENRERLALVARLSDKTLRTAICYRLSSSLDRRVLQQSIDEVVHQVFGNHPVTAGDGQIREPSHSAWCNPVVLIDSVDSSVEAEHLLFVGNLMDRWVTDSSSDDQECSPLKCCLVAADSQTHYLALVVHQTLGNQQFLVRFFEKLMGTYLGKVQNVSSAVPETRLRQYDPPGIEAENTLSLPAWTSLLSLGFPAIPLPVDRRGRLGGRHVVAYHSVDLSDRQYERMETFASKNECSLSDLILAAYLATLYRYSQSEHQFAIVPRTCLQTTVDHLESEQIDDTQLCVIHQQVDRDQPFIDLIGQVRDEENYGAYSQIVRHLSRQGVTEGLEVGYQHHQIDRELEFGDLKAQYIQSRCSIEQLELELHSVEAGRSLSLQVQYNAEVLDARIIKGFTENLVSLVDFAVAAPGRSLAQLCVASDSVGQGHGEGAVVEAATAVVSAPRCLHQMVDEVSRERSDSVAVVYENASLTYRELCARSQTMASRLHQQGLNRNAVIGLSLRRSLDMAVAVLAIHRAGFACMVLDPSVPANRMQYMLRDASVPVVIEHPGILPELVSSSTRTLCFDELCGGQLDAPQQAAFAMEPSPSSTAYVFYTSGTSGNPKGVLHTHESAAGIMVPERAPIRLGTDDRFLLSSISMMPDLYWAWLAGATAVIASDDFRDSDQLSKTISDRRVTVACMGPSMLEGLLQSKELENCDCLDTILLGGDLPRADLHRRLEERLQCTLLNSYGLTETNSATVGTCEVDRSANSLPAGRPLADVSVLILDDAYHCVPSGVPGKIFLATPGLASGYLNLAAETASRFLPNPFAQDLSPRFYATGDRGRWRVDGSLEILGRTDSQIKIDGYRIEISEVEAAMRECPGVGHVVVVPQEIRSIGKRLVAYIVKNPDAVLSPRGIRGFLRGVLPSYMIPSRFMLGDALPRNANGKVDLAQLLAPNAFLEMCDTDSRPPQSKLEKLIFGIWADVLARNDFGIDDSFFELGGNSLLGTQVTARVVKKLNRELPLRTLFDAPTISSFAREIQSVNESSPSVAVPKIKRINRDAYRV